MNFRELLDDSRAFSVFIQVLRVLLLQSLPQLCLSSLIIARILDDLVACGSFGDHLLSFGMIGGVNRLRLGPRAKLSLLEANLPLGQRVSALACPRALNLVQHLEHVHGDRFLIPCLLVDSDLLESNLTVAHLTVQPDKLTLHQEVILVVLIYLLQRFLAIRELMHGLAFIVDHSEKFLLHSLNTVGQVAQPARSHHFHLSVHRGEVREQVDYFGLRCHQKL